MPSRLQSLPPELLEIIAGFCMAKGDRESLLQLRATCPDLEVKCQRIWLDEYFSCRYVKLDITKLAELREVTKVPHLAAAVTEIDVLCKDDPKLRETEEFDELSMATSSEVLMKYSALLALALQNLKNLDTILFDPIALDCTDRNLDKGVSFVDISDTFSVVMSAVQACALHPKTMSGIRHDTEHFEFGIARPSPTLHLEGCLDKLEVLEMFFPNVLFSTEAQLPDIGHREQIGRWLTHMPDLKTLDLGFCHSLRSQETFRSIVETAFIPHMRYIRLGPLRCRLRDLKVFLMAHAVTLRSCNLISVSFATTVSVDKFACLLIDMRDKLRLDNFSMENMWNKEGKFEFPGMDHVDFYDEADEDGYVVINSGQSFKFDNLEDIQGGLTEMIKRVSWTMVA